MHEGFRAGDVRHSQADIGKAERLLGYAPTHDLHAGLRAALPWYLSRYAPIGTGSSRSVGAEAADAA